MHNIPKKFWVPIGVQLLCGMALGAFGYYRLHVAYSGYVGDYYQERQFAGYACVWRSPVHELLLSATGPYAIGVGLTVTAAFSLLQWKIRPLPFWMPVIAYSALACFACCQTAYDVHAWSAHLG